MDENILTNDSKEEIEDSEMIKTPNNMGLRNRKTSATGISKPNEIDQSQLLENFLEKPLKTQVRETTGLNEHF